jgi:hypothetical protein
MEPLKIIIPLITFILVAVATFFLKERENSKKRDRESIEQIAELSTEWYDQILSILSYLRNREDISFMPERVDAYIQNRIILPRYFQHIEILRPKKKYKDFIADAEAFLNVVTRKRVSTKKT